MATYLTLVEDCWVDKQLHRVTNEEMVFKEEFQTDEYVRVISKRNYDEKETIPLTKIRPADHLLIINNRKYRILHMKTA